MMKTNSIKTCFIFVLLASLLLSCEDKVDNPYLTVSPDEIIQVINDGGTASLTIATNVDDWVWKVENGSWLTVNATSSGLTLEAEANQSEERRATLHIASSEFPMVNKMLSIIQGATYMEISSEKIDILGESSVMDIIVNTSVDDWTFSVENGVWASVEKTDAGLRITFRANNSPRTRTATLHITSAKFPVVDKEIPISQISGVILEVDPMIATLPSGGGETMINVTTNADDWSYSFTENWLTAEKKEAGLLLKADPNLGNTNLSTVLTIYSTEYPNDIWKQVEISQYSSLIFEDNFDWLGAGASEIMYTSTGEKRFDSWESTYGTVNGWTSTPSADKGGVVQPYVYSRLGFPKFGKTDVNGDLITPKLVAIDGTQDIVVSFKAVQYMSASAGAIDGNDFNVEVIGPGTITEILSVGSQLRTPEGRNPSSGVLTEAGALFMIGNYHNTSGPSTSHEEWLGYDYNPWAPELAERSFVVSDATKETQIRFISGPHIGVTLGISYRAGFDDVKIVLK